MSSNKFQVCKDQCVECLFSKNAIVSNSRRKEIIQSCLQEDRYFICHMASPEASEDKNGGVQGVCCKGFLDAYGNEINTIRIARRLEAIGCPIIEEVDVEE